MERFSSLVKQLSTTKIDNLTIPKLLAPVDLVNQGQSATVKAEKPGSPGDSKTASLGASVTPKGIQFGKPSSTRLPTSQSGSVFTNLLEQTASGGVSSVLGGGLGTLGGIGGLVSGILSLFGGGSKSAPPALVEFQLPASQQQTVYMSSKGSTVYQGTAVEQGSSSTPSAGTYTNAGQTSNSVSQSKQVQYQSAQIAQAVKNALLNSSSLNDVIAEI